MFVSVSLTLDSVDHVLTDTCPKTEGAFGKCSDVIDFDSTNGGAARCVQDGVLLPTRQMHKRRSTRG
jgi:hypothetical protein